MSASAPAADLREVLASWSDPLVFFEDVLPPDLALRDWQPGFARTVASNRRVALRAIRGSGKTGIVARLALWSLVNRARVLCVAPVHAQADLLRREMESVWRASRLPRLFPSWNFFQDRIETDEPSIALTLASAESGAFHLEGTHGQPVALFIDESKSVPDDVLVSLLPMLISSDSRLVAASTAGTRQGWFDRAFSVERSLWDEAISVGVSECPRLTEKREEMRRMLGENHPVFLAQYENVAGSATTGEPFFDPLKVERAIALPLEPPESAPVVWALDVARFGADASVLARRKGGTIRPLIRWRKADLMATVGKVWEHIQAADEKPDQITIDATGLGSGVADRLRETLEERGVQRHHPIAVMDFIGGASAPRDSEFFGNWKTWSAHVLAGKLERGEASLPTDYALSQELCSYERVTSSSGKSRIKDPSRSPDRGDAVLMLFAWGDSIRRSIATASPAWLGY